MFNSNIRVTVQEIYNNNICENYNKYIETYANLSELLNW